MLPKSLAKPFILFLIEKNCALYIDFQMVKQLYIVCFSSAVLWSQPAASQKPARLDWHVGATTASIPNMLSNLKKKIKFISKDTI